MNVPACARPVQCSNMFFCFSYQIQQSPESQVKRKFILSLGCLVEVYVANRRSVFFSQGTMLFTGVCPSAHSIPKAFIDNVICYAAQSQAGDRVYLEGSSPSQDPPKVLKSDAWRELKSGLRVIDGEACYLNVRLITEKGKVTVPSDLPNGSEIC
jgi:hypothetical protein